jgi:hypothetical protein
MNSQLPRGVLKGHEKGSPRAAGECAVLPSDRRGARLDPQLRPRRLLAVPVRRAEVRGPLCAQNPGGPTTGGSTELGSMGSSVLAPATQQHHGS